MKIKKRHSRRNLDRSELSYLNWMIRTEFAP